MTPIGQPLSNSKWSFISFEYRTWFAFDYTAQFETNWSHCFRSTVQLDLSNHTSCLATIDCEFTARLDCSAVHFVVLLQHLLALSWRWRQKGHMHTWSHSVGTFSAICVSRSAFFISFHNSFFDPFRTWTAKKGFLSQHPSCTANRHNPLISRDKYDIRAAPAESEYVI